MNLDDLDSAEGIFKFTDYFEPKSMLGQGAFGRVVLAVDRETKNECAVKIIPKKAINNKELERLRKEATILSSLKHPNIVKFLSVKETERRVLLVMEYVHGGTLKELIDYRYKTTKQGFTEEECSTVMKYIFEAVTYMHSMGIVHRDIKPENILIGDRKDLSTLKIADFGLSAQFLTEGHTRIFNQQCGTVAFMGPELAQRKPYTKEIDIWSCGIIMYILLAGKHPLLRSSDNTQSFFQKLISPKWNLEKTTFTNLAKNFFLKLVQVDPIARYSAEKALSHPWITRRFDDDIPLSAHEMMRFFDQQQTLQRMVKAMCFFIHLTKGKSNQKQITPQYRELVAKVSAEVEGKMQQEEKRKKNQLHSKHFLEGLFITNPAVNENKKKLSPSINASLQNLSYGSKGASEYLANTTDRSAPSTRRTAASLILSSIEIRDKALDGIEKPQSPRLQDISPKNNLILRANTFEACCLEDRKLARQNSIERNMLKNCQAEVILEKDAIEEDLDKPRRRSDIFLRNLEDTPDYAPDAIKDFYPDMIKISSSKNADELRKEKERGCKPFFSRDTNRYNNNENFSYDVQKAGSQQEIHSYGSSRAEGGQPMSTTTSQIGPYSDSNQNTSRTLSRREERLKTTLDAVNDPIKTTPLMLLRDADVNFAKVSGSARSTAQNYAHQRQLLMLRESQFRKSFLQRVHAAREFRDENTKVSLAVRKHASMNPQEPSNYYNNEGSVRFQSQKQSQTAATCSGGPKNTALPISEPNVNPFNVGVEGERKSQPTFSRPTPKLIKDKSGSFKLDKTKQANLSTGPYQRVQTLQDLSNGRKVTPGITVTQNENITRILTQQKYEPIASNNPLVSKHGKYYYDYTQSALHKLKEKENVLKPSSSNSLLTNGARK